MSLCWASLPLTVTFLLMVLWMSVISPKSGLGARARTIEERLGSALASVQQAQWFYPQACGGGNPLVRLGLGGFQVEARITTYSETGCLRTWGLQHLASRQE